MDNKIFLFLSTVGLGGALTFPAASISLQGNSGVTHNHSGLARTVSSKGFMVLRHLVWVTGFSFPCRR